MNGPRRGIITVGLNPAIDRVIEVPGFRVGEHLKGRVRSRTPAGKALNVSQALALLGVSSTATGFVGRSEQDAFEQAAAQAAITPHFVPIAAPTRENITIVDPTGGPATHIRDIGPTVTRSEIELLEAALQACCTPLSIVVFGGSLPEGLTPGAFGRLLRICAHSGAAIVADTSGEALKEAWRARPWLLKLNRSELAELAGSEAASEEAGIIGAGRQLAREIPIVLVTLGEQGALCFTPHAAWRGQCRIAAEQIRSTVGCGDAFLAGFLAPQLETPRFAPGAGITSGSHDPSQPIEKALRQALAVGAAAALTELPARFNASDVEQLLAQTTVDTVSQ